MKLQLCTLRSHALGTRFWFDPHVTELEACLRPFLPAILDARFDALQDKRQVYLERLYLLQQRLARNPLFNRPVFGELDARDFVEVIH